MDQSSPKPKFLERWTPKVIREAKQVFREGGIKGVLRRYGWKVFAVFFVYYLVRDITIYILLPLYLTNKLF